MAAAPVNALPDLNPAALRARFKKRCADTGNVYQNWQIRVHRSLSWLTRGLEFPEDEPEARFLYLWIALNSLYSRWNAETNRPDDDSHARNDFLARTCRLDAPLVAAALHRHRSLVRNILGDRYLSPVFWRNPDNPTARGRATQDARHIDQHLKRKEYATLLKQMLDRLFVLRGQIVHGASTRGSRLNRNGLRYGRMLLEQFVPVILHITIEQACNDDWPDLCYPPEP